MNWQEYIDDVRDCAVAFMDENYQHAASYSDVHDVMINEDSVTGNGSGSYTYNRAQAEENIAGIIEDPEVLDKFLALGYTEFPDEPESVDVIARMLALDELYDELEERFYENR